MKRVPWRVHLVVVFAAGCTRPSPLSVDRAFDRIDSGAQREVLAELAELPSIERAGSSDVHFILGYICERAALLDSALWYYQRAYELGSGDEHAVLFAQARVQYDRRDYDEAFNVLSIIDRQDSCYRAVRYYQALALAAADLGSAAVERCLAQLRCSPTDTLALSKLASLELGLGRYDEAIEHARSRLSFNRATEDVCVLAKALSYKGDHEVALLLIDSTLVQLGPSGSLYASRAAIFGDLDRIAEMKHDLIRAIEMDSSDTEARALIQLAFDSGEIGVGDTLYPFVGDVSSRR